MQTKTTFRTLALLPFALTGCGGGEDPAGDTTASSAGTNTSGGGAGSTTGTPTTTDGESTTGAPTGCLSAMASDGSLSFITNPANNYSFSSTVDFMVTQVAPNANLTVDWSQLSEDFMGHAIDPQADVAMVFLALLNLTVEDFKANVNADERLNPFSVGSLAMYTEGMLTSSSVYEGYLPGTEEPASQEEIAPYLDPTIYDPATHTYALLVQESTNIQEGIRMVHALQIDPGSLNTHVDITNASTTLQHQAILTTLQPVQVPVGTANITVDWSQMTINSMGREWTERSVNEVMIGQYSLTPAELEAQFLDLELIADQLFRGQVEAGSKLNISALTEETSSAAFTGITETGTWVLALNCGDCTNPAPWYLTILQPCSG